MDLNYSIDPVQSKDDLFINREISWLHFNERVLQEAVDPATPLLERLKFLGIYSNNRDEFFRVRVGTLNRMAHAGQRLNYPVGFDPKSTLLRITELVQLQEKKFNEAYQNLVLELASENIFIINETQLNEEQGDYVRRFFKEILRSFLFPVMLNSVKSLKFLKDQSLYLAVKLTDSHDRLKENAAVIKVPTQRFSRFLLLPSAPRATSIILLDDVIRYCLADIFLVLGYDRYEAYTIKFTRDAELDIDNDVNKSFLEVMSHSVKKRKEGLPVRFVYDRQIPPKLLDRVMKKLKISDTDNVRAGGRYHNFKDFMSFPHVGQPRHYFKPFPPLPHRLLPDNKSIMAAIRRSDIMLHFPYQSFRYIIDLLREASVDPKVKEIKMTFYRAARDSSLINSLINAQRNGKKVTVFLELQARFDEEANIYWSNRLQEEGVKIIPTITGYKVHAKLLLIRRVEDDKDVLYANISTGNFNESTANVYADDSLLTADADLTEDVNNVFKLFETRYIPPVFKKLKVAPFAIRQFLLELLNNEIAHAKAGKKAWAIIKINSIVDDVIARKLYEASSAGVEIKMIIRGISIIVGGKKGVSENIRAVSIVDRFLEHTRVYVFGNDGDSKMYISSADWMQRNFDHRIEVACPVENKQIKEEIMQMLQFELADNTKARLIHHGQINEYLKRGNQKKVRSQFAKYDYFSQWVDSSLVDSNKSH